MLQLQFEKTFRLLKSKRGERYNWQVIHDEDNIEDKLDLATWFSIDAIGYWLVTQLPISRLKEDARLLTNNNRYLYFYLLTHAQAHRLCPYAVSPAPDNYTHL